MFIYGRILLGFQNLLNSEKKQTLESSTTRNQKNENSENSRARHEGYFHWIKASDDDIFVVRYSTTVGPLEVYLQNLKSLRCLRSLPAFEAEGFGAFEICHFSERCPKEYVFDVCEVCENQKRQKNVPK